MPPPLSGNVNHHDQNGIQLSGIAKIMFDSGIEMQRIAGRQNIDMISHLNLHLSFQDMDKLLSFMLKTDPFMMGSSFHHNTKRF